MAGKISELKFEAPLARFEEEDTASLKNMNLLTGARTLVVPYPISHSPVPAALSRIRVTSAAGSKVYRDALESR